jgi:cyclase
MTYAAGLTEIGDGAFAYLQPDGSWGWSNAGLLVGSSSSFLIDTLFSLDLTRRMLDAMAVHTAAAPIGTLVNTHANGDHCFGNQLVDGARVIMSQATAEELSHVPASLLHAMKQDPGPLGEVFRHMFGPFDFSGIDVPPPDETFTGAMSLTIDDRAIELIQLGPAHTDGDVIVHLPDAGIVYTGDLLFIDGTPISWAGTLTNWMQAVDRIIALAPSVIVPGHGPLTDIAGARRVGDYLHLIDTEGRARHAAGMSSDEAARDIALGDYAGWLDAERVAVNVATLYRELAPDAAPVPVPELFLRMGRLAGII